MRLRNVIVVGSAFAFLSVAAEELRAQTGAQPGQDEKGPKVHQPALDPVPEMPGWRGTALQGTTSTEGHRFIIPNLDVMQPVGVLLIAPGGNDKLTLKVFKDDFEKPLKEASTNGSSPARFQGRTQGALRLMVYSEEGAKRYQLLIMVGSEIKRPVPSLFVPISMAGAPAATAGPTTAASQQESSSKGGTPVLWIIAGSLVVIVALLAAILLRKNKAQKVISILVAVVLPILLSTYLRAQDVGGIGEPEKIPFKEAATKEATEWLEWLVKRQNDQAEKIMELFEALSAADELLQPTYAGMPGIPTACVSAVPKGIATAINDVDWTGPCGECFTEAHDSVALTLQRFEKLRRVNTQTKEVYDKSLAFGDAASQVGGITTAAGWMKVRNGIKAEMDKYYVVYDDKVEELSLALVSSLKKVAACEAKFFKNASWYERYGFMFVTPIVDRHRR